MELEQLVQRFADIGVAQDEALLHNEVGKFNRLSTVRQAEST